MLPESKRTIPKLVVGLITYGENTAKYLPYFLPSLTGQSFIDFKLVAIDNSDSENNPNSEFIKKNYPQVDLEWAGANLGFAKAYNRMIAKAATAGAEYFLAVNPDMIFSRDFISRILEAIETDKNLGSVAPKILHWDFVNNTKTNIFDSGGIKLKPVLRFFDIGQGEEDKGQYDNTEILGPSGAAALYRLEALIKTAENGRFFDENMFMYKEDCDLAYRLKLAGYRSKLAALAIAYHDRSVSGQGESDASIILNRRKKSRQSRRWSFVNQQLIYAKFWRTLDIKNRLALMFNQIKLLAYIIIFEQYLLFELPCLYKLRKNIKYY